VGEAVVIQAVMGWFDNHLWEFTIGEHRYGLPMDEDRGTAPRQRAAAVRLRDVLKPRKTTINYLYDFGDSWEHRFLKTSLGASACRSSKRRFNVQQTQKSFSMMLLATPRRAPVSPNTADRSDAASRANLSIR